VDRVLDTTMTARIRITVVVVVAQEDQAVMLRIVTAE
jgi:hypothetical protein